MLHTIDALLTRVTAMHDIALLAHAEKYTKGKEYNVELVTSYVEQIQSMALTLAGDRQLHPKLRKDISNEN